MEEGHPVRVNRMCKVMKPFKNQVFLVNNYFLEKDFFFFFDRVGHESGARRGMILSHDEDLNFTL